MSSFHDSLYPKCAKCGKIIDFDFFRVDDNCYHDECVKLVSIDDYLAEKDAESCEQAYYEHLDRVYDEYVERKEGWFD